MPQSLLKEIESEFIFALTNRGSETALKMEVESMNLGWRLSYQRRGFVTFKAAEGKFFSLGELEFPVACARRLCLSLGKSTTRAAAEQKILRHPACLDRMVHFVCYEDHQYQTEPELAERPRIGDCIGTVVEIAPDEFWAGLHLHARHLSPDPGGISPLVMPETSPSRAWLKVEEAIRFFDLNFTRRDKVVELGCAPGGVVLSLLDRGVSVVGVDPAEMAAVVMKSAVTERRYVPEDRPWFYHCQKPAALVSKRDLGSDVTWFMSDMNQSPEVVLKECERLCRMAKTVNGVLITLKLTDMERVVEKEKWFASLRAMGFAKARLQQFSVHHREFALLAGRTLLN